MSSLEKFLLSPLVFDPPILLLQALCLVGEFNNWTPKDNQWAFKNAFGVWELFLADNEDGTPVIPHK